MDFESDQSLVAELKAPAINRTVKKPTKKRAPVNMKKPAAKRPALKDRTNINDTEGQEEDAAPPKKKARKAPARAADDETEVEMAEPAPAKKTKPAPRGAKKEDLVIPETQPEVDTTETVEDSVMPDVVPAHKPRSTSASATRRTAAPAYTRARSTSAQPRTFSREPSASLAERRPTGGDAELRRKLADVTGQYEDMRLRYEALSALGSRGEESNFDKLKRATDQRARDATELITSLKRELGDAKKALSVGGADSAKLQTKLGEVQAAREQAAAELKASREELAAARNESKALTAKLEAAREAARKAAAVEPRVPGSAVKNARGVPDTARRVAKKEELYRDLTGLIINSVKEKEGEDEFSCIQTGRNGTLHFHLVVSNDSSVANPKTPSGLSYEDAEFAYEPFFEEGRDRDLIDLLPDYLTEEICFPRGHAVKFYTKVVDSMTKKVVMEE